MQSTVESSLNTEMWPQAPPSKERLVAQPPAVPSFWVCLQRATSLEVTSFLACSYPMSEAGVERHGCFGPVQYSSNVQYCSRAPAVWAKALSALQCSLTSPTDHPSWFYPFPSCVQIPNKHLAPQNASQLSRLPEHPSCNSYYSCYESLSFSLPKWLSNTALLRQSYYQFPGSDPYPFTPGLSASSQILSSSDATSPSASMSMPLFSLKTCLTLCSSSIACTTE